MNKILVVFLLIFSLYSCGNEEIKKESNLLGDSVEREINIEKQLFYIENKGGDSVLYLNEDGKKIEIDRSPSRIENSEIVGKYLVYDWISTGGMMKKIYSLEKKKVIEKIIFGELTDDKKYIYGYEETGFGSGSIVILNLSNLYLRDLGKELEIGKNGIFLSKVEYNDYKINFVLTSDDFLKKYVYDIKNNKLIEEKNNSK